MGTIQIDGSTPKLTIGNATAEDATILFDGNAQDFYIALDDSADDLLIGLGSTVGTTPAISIDENLQSTFGGDVIIGGATPTLTIGDAGAEDTKIVFDGNAQDFHIGLDDTADDLVIGLGSALGTTTHMAFDEAGHVTMPLQSAFFAVLDTAQNNATGDSTAVDIGTWGTEVVDRNADFNSSSGVFTAPVTGLYVIMSNGLIQGIESDHNDNQFKVISSNRTYDTLGEISSSSIGFSGSLNQSFCGVIDMDASDTVKLQIDFRSGSKVVDIHDGFKFSGYLLG